ncbi:DUF4279 domain-containing protein [Sinosporangium siamense]|uniref:Uncharacterized protein n=1 Tax=Sinosporangium siamense TaxID=1367973 RepID=A0A919V6D9_9ACTN|nr:DUF4279 domain-containing protein [Sinosporangium siamense]GII91906.1 hypothetical protein Ssi02_21370 [Sinosporangium siamense]
MFRVRLRLVSDNGDPAAVTGATGIPPNRSFRAGETSTRTGKKYRFSQWSKSIGQESETDGIDDAIAEVCSWGLNTARSFREICLSDNWEASLVIIQEIRDADDPHEKGISLTSTAISWLAAAGASLEIDQYLFV